MHANVNAVEEYIHSTKLKCEFSPDSTYDSKFCINCISTSVNACLGCISQWGDKILNFLPMQCIDDLRLHNISFGIEIFVMLASISLLY